jgi:16S rRNA (cytidine1402-2'-O)-methyltransferase
VGVEPGKRCKLSPVSAPPGTVYLVPTPIGNLGDITLRALEVLKSVDAIACEDTRHSGKLLMHFGINKPLERLDAHTMASRARGILERYPRLAFVSDAGTPGLSDPGTELVRLAVAMGYRIEALPGATALIPALVLSGLSTSSFAFYGFLARSGKERRTQLEVIARSPITTVIYESPRRLEATLKDLIAVCGAERSCAVARELTKLHEEIHRGTLEQTLVHFAAGEIRGEIVLVIAAMPATLTPIRDFAADALTLAREGQTAKDIRATLQSLGADRNAAYDLALNAVREAQGEL